MLPRPEPAAGNNAYLKERELALSRSPECLANYRKYQARNGVDYLPIKLDIENVSRCNFKCGMCPVSTWHKGQRAADLSFESFKTLIDEQYGVVEIKLQGLGEPTLQRDAFFEMIRYARSKHIWVRTTTNASLLHLNDNYRKLVDSDVNEIQISIDGATKEVFEKIRRGSNFERVKSNCKLINSYSNERTKMWTVVQKDNVHQLEALVHLAAELKFTNQVFSLDVHDWGLSLDNDGLNVDAPPDLMSLVEIGKTLGVKVMFWVVTDKYDKDHPCPWPFERMFVSSDMRVVPCCVIGNPDTLQLGEAISAENTLTDIWFGQDYRKFRQDHIEGRIPNACAECYRKH